MEWKKTATGWQLLNGEVIAAWIYGSKATGFRAKVYHGRESPLFLDGKSVAALKRKIEGKING